MKKLIVSLAYVWDLLCGIADIGYDCPKCKSEDTESYMPDRRQNCLHCGHEFPVPLHLKIDLEWGGKKA